MNFNVSFGSTGQSFTPELTASEHSYTVSFTPTEQAFTASFESTEQGFTLEMEASEQTYTMGFGAVTVVTPDPYTGSYDVVPTWENQTLPTQGKNMTANLLVEKIRSDETANPSGGNTLTVY